MAALPLHGPRVAAICWSPHPLPELSVVAEDGSLHAAWIPQVLRAGTVVPVEAAASQVLPAPTEEGAEVAMGGANGRLCLVYGACSAGPASCSLLRY